jgi:hypothetical protein
MTHTHPVELLSTSDQPVSEAATYTTRNRQNRHTSMPSAGFQLALLAIELLQTYTLDRTTTGIGFLLRMVSVIS